MLRRHLRSTVLSLQSILFEAGDTIAKAYFPYSGAVSLAVVLSEGQMIETAIVGRHGVVGGSAALDAQPASCRAIVQLEGAAWAIDMELLRQIAKSHPAIRSLLNWHEWVLLAQTQQAVACNASHALEARLCCWLLRASDACGKTILSTTQDSVAEILGVRRTSISLVAHNMQQAGYIRTRRGQIEILNMEALRQGACECYGKTALHYDRLLSAAGPRLNEVQIA
ncbi:MAG: hypothetical protein QOG83_3629 [Alphaproteobacteria bacterium]|nr:hypothetical protein [Alphaproteobacteria bacterium]